MSDTMQISAEDRERLAKGKFAEWFNELFDSKIEEAVKKHVKTPVGPTAKAATGGDPASNDSGQQQQQADPPPRRRSLLETCLSDTFGF